ncbi:HET domain-containing protein [Diaporthe helianthi]|uniref:HET domain-containing protein n=1 Tax=Diaporthe helianthi TaxID=158607 RepID=A0A2P5HGJ6_DIAHE|nr:HET domain-containing protein [Diaporthe helianthi]
MYEAVSLEPGEFRVLQLDPAHDVDDPIVTHLIKAPVHSPPIYDALSYRWEGGDLQTVSVNGADLHVTDNLYAALRSLRQEAHPLPRVLWVDSLCINQGSGPERAEQVPLMGEIYSQAHAVRIWLGEEVLGAGDAFKLVRDCGTLTPAEVVGRVLDDEEGAKALVEVLQRSYWNRIWMFQEVVLATDAIVHCGSHEAPWSSFKWLHQVTSENSFWEEFEFDDEWIRDLRRALFRISLFNIPREVAEDVNSVSIPTRHLQATDPRDKVYGLMGVCGELSKAIKVDYAAPVRDVYADFARSQIEAEGDLLTLLTAGSWAPQNGEDIQLPSWVPDLRGTAGVDTRYMTGAYLGTYNADGSDGSDPFFSFSTDGEDHIIEVEALIYDSVDVYMKNEHEDEDHRKVLIDTFCKTADGGEFSVSKLRQYFEVITFGKPILAASKDQLDRRQKKGLERLALGMFEDLLHRYGPQQAFVDFVQSFSDVGLDLLDKHSSEISPDFGPDELRRDEAEYLFRTGSIGDAAAATFATANGCIGIGPRDLEQGGLVAIVRGSRVPLLLRRQDDNFRLVGPAYVSNIMQGEAVSASDGSTDQSFERVKII